MDIGITKKAGTYKSSNGSWTCDTTTDPNPKYKKGDTACWMITFTNNSSQFPYPTNPNIHTLTGTDILPLWFSPSGCKAWTPNDLTCTIVNGLINIKDINDTTYHIPLWIVSPYKSISIFITGKVTDQLLLFHLDNNPPKLIKNRVNTFTHNLIGSGATISASGTVSFVYPDIQTKVSDQDILWKAIWDTGSLTIKIENIWSTGYSGDLYFTGNLFWLFGTNPIAVTKEGGGDTNCIVPPFIPAVTNTFSNQILNTKKLNAWASCIYKISWKLAKTGPLTWYFYAWFAGTNAELNPEPHFEPFYINNNIAIWTGTYTGPITDLAIQKEWSCDPISVAKITITNTWTVNITGFTISDNLPVGVTFQDGKLKTGTGSNNPQVICENTIQGFYFNQGNLQNGLWVISGVNIPPGESCIYTVWLTGDTSSNNQSLLNQSSISNIFPSETANISIGVLNDAGVHQVQYDDWHVYIEEMNQVS